MITFPKEEGACRENHRGPCDLMLDWHIVLLAYAMNRLAIRVVWSFSTILEPTAWRTFQTCCAYPGSCHGITRSVGSAWQIWNVLGILFSGV
jgi:hypothetical protein